MAAYLATKPVVGEAYVGQTSLLGCNKPTSARPEREAAGSDKVAFPLAVNAKFGKHIGSYRRAAAT